MRAHLVAAAGALSAWCAVADAAPAVAEARYDGPRLAFTIPTGTQVKDATDVAADYALELLPPGDPKVKQSTLRLLLSNNRVVDVDVEGVASAWRDARLRNRASWGVHKREKDADRSEITHVGSRRFVRFTDQMGSVLGAQRQIMLCGSISARLVCAVMSGQQANERAAEAVMLRVLETLTVKKR